MSKDHVATSVSDPLPTVHVDALEGQRLQRALIGSYVGPSGGVTVQPGDNDAGDVEARLEAVLGRLPGARLDTSGSAYRIRFDTEPVPDPFEVVADIHGDAQALLAIAVRSISEEPGTVDKDRRESVEERCDGRLFHLLREDRRGADWSRHDRRTALDAAERLERIADYAYGISRRAEELSPQERVGVIGDRIAEAIEDGQRLVAGAHHAVQRPDLELGQDVVEEVRSWSSKLEEKAVSMAGSGLEPGHLPGDRLYRGYFSLLEDAQRIGLYAKSIAEAGVDRACSEHDGSGEWIRIGSR